MSQRAARPTEGEIAARRDVERLEARVADLTRMIAGRSASDGPVAPLTLQQTMIVGAIATQGRMSRQDMRVYLRRSGFETGEMRNQIYETRLRLVPLGITIDTLPRWGWAMDDRSRAIWRALATPPRPLDQVASEQIARSA